MNANNTEWEETASEFLNYGGGVSIPPTEPLHPAQIPAPKFEDEEEELERAHNIEYDYLLNDDSKKQFVDEPCYPDQYARYPETVKRVGPTIRTFDLSKPDDEHELNKLMSGSQNHSAPRSLLAIMDKQWSDKDGNWKILAQVYKFKYLKILERD